MSLLSDFSLTQLLGIRLLLAVLMATLGAVAAIGFRKISHLGLCMLISFAAGALLAVTLFEILPETFHLVGWTGGAVSMVAGYLFFFVLTRFVFHVCPACSATHTEANFKALTISMVVALAVHSFMDGLAIYSGYVSGESAVGFLILLAVAYHKFPEGMALALVARGSGMSRARAFFLSFSLEAVTTIAGGLVGLLIFVPESSQWMGYVLGFVGGGFLFIVIHALLSEVVKHHPFPTVLAAIAGAVSILSIGFVFGVF